MLDFLSRRLAAALVTLVLATVVVFGVVEVLPGGGLRVRAIGGVNQIGNRMFLHRPSIDGDALRSQCDLLDRVGGCFRRAH